VSDIGAAHVLALNYLANGGDSISLNLGTGKGTSIRELIGTFERLTGLEVQHEFVAPRAGDPPVLYADPAKANVILGWRAQRNLEEILRSAWAWQQRLEV
jgi:UDP-glucose 4-epimerase